MSGKIYYIRVEIPGKHGEYNYVPADPTRVDRSTIQCWYEKKPQERGGGYVSAFGIEKLVSDDLDVSELLKSIEEIVNQYKSDLAGEGAAKPLEILTLLQSELPKVVSALARGETHHAKEALLTLLWGLPSVLSEIAAALEKTEERLSGAEAALQDVVENLPELEAMRYLKWAEAANDLSTCVDSLLFEERKLRELLRDAEGTRAAFLSLIDVEDPELVAALDFLERSSESFTLKAFAWLRSDPLPEETNTAIAQAKEYIGRCRLHEETAREAWEKLRRRVQHEVLPMRQGIRDLCEQLKEATERFSAFCAEAQSVGTQARPFSVPNALITREAYERAERLLRDSQWGPLTCRSRVEGLIATLVSLPGTEPKLPLEITDVLSFAEQYIRQIEELQVEEGQVRPSESSPADDEEAEAEAPKTQVERPAASSGPPRPERLAELEELVTAVGYVLTCNAAPFGQSNIKAMMETLELLGKCSKEEVAAFRLVSERIEQPTRIERLHASGTVIQRWRDSSARWLWYHLKGSVRWSLKLTERSAMLGQQLLVKYGLTREAIKEAQRVRRELKTEARGTRPPQR